MFFTQLEWPLRVLVLVLRFLKVGNYASWKSWKVGGLYDVTAVQ